MYTQPKTSEVFLESSLKTKPTQLKTNEALESLLQELGLQDADSVEEVELFTLNSTGFTMLRPDRDVGH